MKKMIKLLISIFIFIPVIINARANYEDSVSYANNYIYGFEEYNDYIYLNERIPYSLEENGNKENINFKSGGFISRREYEISNVKGNSYLSNGLQYWTLTKSSYLKHYIVDYKLVEELDSNTSGIRITEFTKPDVSVSGTGSYSNPWVFGEVLSINIYTDSILKGKVSNLECSNISMRKEGIHLNITENGEAFFYSCPEEGYKYLNNSCTKYIGNYINSDRHSVGNLDKDSLVCKIYFSYVTKPITLTGCESCSTGKVDRTIYVNNTHKVWLSNSDGTTTIGSIDNLPKKTGYTFNGYYTEESYTNKVVDIDGKLIYNMSLNSKDTAYPYMKANEYKIKYDCNGGKGSTAQSEHKYDQEKQLTINECTRTGYKFNGWSKTSTGTKEYSDNESVTNLSSTQGDVVTLYAVWKKNEVTIKYHVNGGSITKNTKSDSNVEYTWTTTDGYVYKNGTLLTTKIKYGEEMDENGLKNYNNSKYLEIGKSGYVGSSKNEWKCTSGDCKDKTYNQNKVYNASDFCDSSNGDCTVVLKVNWVSNPPVITFTLKDSTSTATCTDSITGNVIKTDTKTVGDSTHTLTCENSGVSATCSQKYKKKTTTVTGLYSCACPGTCGNCNGVFCYSCCNYCGTSTSTTVSKDGNMSCN